MYIYVKRNLLVPQDFNLLEKLGTKSPLNFYLDLIVAKIYDKIVVSGKSVWSVKALCKSSIY